MTKANDLWPTAAELQRMDLGALQALGAFADTPQKRAMLMDAIRKNPDVQPTSVSDLLGMGKDHVARAQAPALTAMKGAKPKSTVDLAKKIYQMRLDEHRARIRQSEEARDRAAEGRRTDIHPLELEKRRLANEAARRKAMELEQTRELRDRTLEAKTKKAEADARKAARKASARGGAGAKYKKEILNNLANYGVDYRDYKAGGGMYAGLGEEERVEMWKARTGPLYDATPESIAADFRAAGGRRGDRQIATNVGKALTPKKASPMSEAEKRQRDQLRLSLESKAADLARREDEISDQLNTGRFRGGERDSKKETLYTPEMLLRDRQLILREKDAVDAQIRSLKAQKTHRTSATPGAPPKFPPGSVQPDVILENE